MEIEEDLKEEKVLTTDILKDEPKIEVKPEPVKKIKPVRVKKEIYVDDAKEILRQLEGYISSVTDAISRRNAQGAYISLQNIIKNYKEKIL